jgi:hypothetical protein
MCYMGQYYKVLYKWFVKFEPTATSHLLALMPGILESQILIARERDFLVSFIGCLIFPSKWSYSIWKGVMCWMTLRDAERDNLKASTAPPVSLRCYRGADKSLARPTSRCILFDGENISFDARLVIYINSTNIPPIMVINRVYEHQHLLSL